MIFSSQIGTFGYQPGNLTIFAGGNIVGRFLVRNGVAELSAMGNFGSSGNMQLIEAAPALPVSLSNKVPALDVHINVAAQGEVDLATVVNPTYAENSFSAKANLGYSETSSVSLTAVTGSVTITGDVPSLFSSSYSVGSSSNGIFPATLTVIAGQDILLTGSITLAPYALGNLSLVAGKDIDGLNSGDTTGRSQIIVADLNPALAYGTQTTSPDWLNGHDPDILHFNDPNPILVSAGRDLENIELILPKEAQIQAGRDISNIYFVGQNLSQNDTTKITAGGDITFNSMPGDISANSGIQIFGPGQLVVQAGGSLDLGTTSGIQSLGNTANAGLASLYTEGASVMVIAGFTGDISHDGAANLFDQLSSASVQISQFLALGENAQANQVIDNTRKNDIDPVIGDPSKQGPGNIDMTTSQIDTADGGNVYVLANGAINVGKSAFITNAQREGTGIYTGYGGSVNVFAEGDVQVQESRVMTYMGGDITVWSEYGEINAGRGSKTVINASPPTITYVDGAPMEVFHPPAEGSGIRAFTYAPEGVYGAVPAPPLGNIYLRAKVINAGEAGIFGNKVFIGGHAVNVANINSVGGIVVAPTSSAGSAGLGSLSGMGGVNQDMKAQETAMASAASGKVGQSVSDAGTFDAGSLDVKVISYLESDDEDPDSMKKKSEIN